MPFIAPAIVGAIGLAGPLASVGAALINAGIAVGLSYVAKALQPATQVETGIQTTIQMGGDQPRGYALGEVGTDGHFIYGNTANQNLNLLQFVFAIGEGPHDDLTRIWVNGKSRNLTLVEQTAYYKKFSVSGFVAKDGVTKLLYVYFYHGLVDQPACAELDTWALPTSRWTANDRLAGVSYVVVSAFYSEEAFDSGIPRFRFGVRGRRLYDWRKDSTAGGSGAHRWGDETTWEYSENPAVQLYNYQRGLYLAGNLVVGMGVPPVDLPLDRYTAAANACDEAVPAAEGGEQDRYRCSTYVTADEEHGTVMERLLDSCVGSLYERVGSYAPIVGVAQTVTYPTITDADLVTGYPVRFARKLGRADLVNGIHGQCVSADEQYGLVSYAARTDAAAEAEDTEKRPIPVDFPQVTVQSQAQRLAQIQLNLARLQATATITLGLRAIPLEPGDWVRWNSARFGDFTFIILSLTQNVDQTVTLNLRQIAASAFGWSADDELPAPAPSEEGDGGGLANSVTGFSLLAFTQVGDTGVKSPAVRVFWSPIADPTVSAVLIEYRIAGTTDVLAARAPAVSAGEVLVTSGLVGETAYEFRATIETAPAREVVWTSWVGVTTTEQAVTSTPAPDSITPEQMTAALRDLVLTRTQAALTSLQAGFAQLAIVIADVDAAGDLNRRELVRELSVQLGAASARFSEEITAAVGPDSAIVQQVTDLAAAVENVDASLKARFVVAVTPAGAIAAYELQATAEEASAGLRVIARDDGAGGAIGEVQIDADRFYVSGDGINGTPIFLVDNTGPSPVVYLNGDLVASGSITADKLDVTELSAIVANLGEIIAGLLRSADNKLRIELDNARILISS